jgi:galactonate dehydratase
MKITDVKLRFAKHYLFVQIYTDAGITGLGEAGNWGYYRPQQQPLKSLQIT